MATGLKIGGLVLALNLPSVVLIDVSIPWIRIASEREHLWPRIQYDMIELARTLFALANVAYTTEQVLHEALALLTAILLLHK